MRQFHDMLFLGNGQHSVAEAERLRKLLDDSIVTLGGLQQGLGGCESQADYEQGKAQHRADQQSLEDAVRDIAAALLGRRIIFGSYLGRRDDAQPKLATEVPEPPVVTPELLDQLREEAAAWRAAFGPMVKAIENITSEDLSTRCK